MVVNLECLGEGAIEGGQHLGTVEAVYVEGRQLARDAAEALVEEDFAEQPVDNLARDGFDELAVGSRTGDALSDGPFLNIGALRVFQAQTSVKRVRDERE